MEQLQKQFDRTAEIMQQQLVERARACDQPGQMETLLAEDSTLHNLRETFKTPSLNVLYKGDVNAIVNHLIEMTN